MRIAKRALEELQSIDWSYTGKQEDGERIVKDLKSLGLYTKWVTRS